MSTPQERFAAVRENQRKLRACARHRFQGGFPGIGQSQTCAACSGVMHVHDIHTYVLGYVAAGGQSGDVTDWFPQ